MSVFRRERECDALPSREEHVPHGSERDGAVAVRVELGRDDRGRMEPGLYAGECDIRVPSPQCRRLRHHPRLAYISRPKVASIAVARIGVSANAEVEPLEPLP